MENDTPDVFVENHGSLLLFRPTSPAANSWLVENTDSEAQWLGLALVVEPRYAHNLVQGLQEAGFIVA